MNRIYQALLGAPLALLAGSAAGQLEFTRGCVPSGPFVCQQNPFSALPIVCQSPSGPACCGGAPGCPSPCPVESGFHDSSANLGSFEQDSHHCCTLNQSPCDDLSELTNEANAPPLLPFDTRCLQYLGLPLPALIPAESDAGPGCTFYCGDGFFNRAGNDLVLGTLDDEECDDGGGIEALAISGGSLGPDGCSDDCEVETVLLAILLSGQAVNGAVIAGILSLTLNDSGSSAALVDLLDGRRALLAHLARGAGISAIAKVGDPVAGRLGLFHAAFLLSLAAIYTDLGVAILPCEVVNGVSDPGLCRLFHPFGIALLRGDPAGGGARFESVFGSPAVNPVAFAASLQIGPGGVTAANDTGLWLELEAGSAPQLVVREGSAAPGLTGPVFEDLAALRPSLAIGSALAFAAALRVGTGGVVSEDDGVLYRGTPGTLNVLAREGGAAPNTTGVFDSFLTGTSAGAALNSAGDVAFDALLRVGTGGVTETNRAGVWKTVGGALQLIARAGSPAPGTPAGVVFRDFRDVVLDDAGDVAFIASLAGPGIGSANDVGVWSGRTALQLLARTGDPAPGGPGLLFGAFPGGPSLNANGQVLVPARLQVGPGGVTAASDGGLWLSDTRPTLQLLVREGDPLTIAPGDVAAIAALDLAGIGSSGGGDGRAKFLNDRGEAAFVATLTDGRSAGFIASVAGPCFDPDGDSVCSDGDISTVAGDTPCSGGATANCDDNCPRLANPSQANADADALGDACDNCRFHATANESDTDADGRGNACECSDQNGDGSNTVSDLVAINLAIFNPALITPLCDGNGDGSCNVSDIIAANVEIFSPTSTSICARQPVPGP
jgi:hypothetical protein